MKDWKDRGYISVMLYKETTERLKKIKIIKRESYDGVINRLIDEHEAKHGKVVSG